MLIYDVWWTPGSRQGIACDVGQAHWICLLNWGTGARHGKRCLAVELDQRFLLEASKRPSAGARSNGPYHMVSEEVLWQEPITRS